MSVDCGPRVRAWTAHPTADGRSRTGRPFGHGPAAIRSKTAPGHRWRAPHNGVDIASPTPSWRRQNPIGDNLVLDLRGAFEDLGQPGVAPVALHREVGGVAVAAVD